MNRTPKGRLEVLTPTKVRQPAPITSPTKRTEGKPLSTPTNLHPAPAFKVREKVFVLPNLQEILQKLHFNTFQPFPFEEIETGRNRLNGIYNNMKTHDTPNCLIHGQRLNLYCEKDKELACVDCVYKDVKHKAHSIVPLDRVIKSLQFEAIRMQEKVQQVIDTLLEWEHAVSKDINDLSDIYLNISNTMSSIFKAMIQEINRVEVECSKIILQNYTRTSNIMRKYADTIDKARGVFHSQLRFVGELDEVNKIGFLREINSQVIVCERLIKKTGETLSSLVTWKDVNTNLERLNDKKKKDEESIKDRQIIVTEF